MADAGFAPYGWKNSHGDRRGAAGFVNGKATAIYEPGARKGKLTVVSADRTDARHPTFHVRCDCGSEFITGAYLSTIDACKGCRPKKRIGAARKYSVKASEYLLYKMWCGMKHRCNPNGKGKKNARYGWRGIQVCAEWHEFAQFEKWALANGYREGLSLDRLNSDGNYEPSNCEWVSRSENSKRCRAEYQMVRIRPGERSHFPIEMLWGAG